MAAPTTSPAPPAPWKVSRRERRRVLRDTYLRLEALSAGRWSKLLVLLLAFHTLTLAAALERSNVSGPAGWVGLASGIAVVALVANASRMRRWLIDLGLVLATVPFAVLTWWSVVTPLIAVLTLAIGIPTLGRPPDPTTSSVPAGEGRRGG